MLVFQLKLYLTLSCVWQEDFDYILSLMCHLSSITLYTYKKSLVTTECLKIMPDLKVRSLEEDILKIVQSKERVNVRTMLEQ